ncbi:response regulator transcription factor [Flavobacterium fluviatile]|uniref:response regulator transcription factor n=1 Tax=Flavobacterium fluviatile TaxID=1862387 RepID=UPI0013D32FC4|nr:response regulator transcription factor [Flavobacterium fluviatile]
MKILLIEDEHFLSESIKDYLSGSGILCECVDKVGTALNKIAVYHYDCIVLDLGLPDGSGLELLLALKKQNRNEGVIIITANGLTLEDKIEGFNSGADDYLTKPFELAELMVRIIALVRRKQFNGNNIVLYNEIAIDMLAKTVKVGDIFIDITKTEIDLLLYLVANENKVLSKSTIAEHISGDMADMLDNHHFVYAHIKNLKKKLVDAGYDDYIKTLYGMGYKWTMKNE